MTQLHKLALVAVLLLTLAAAPALLAQEEETEPTIPPNSITGIIDSSDQLHTLAAALEQAGLADRFTRGRWTFFAPTDEAFARLGLNAENIGENLSRTELRDLIFYHALRGRYSTADLKANLGDVVMGNNALAGLKYYDGAVYVNDMAKIVVANTPADNGYVQMVDSVIVGPWPRVDTPVAAVVAMPAEATEAAATETPGEMTATEGTEPVAVETTEGMAAPEAPAATVPANSIAGIAVADGRFSTLVAAVQASGLLDELAGGEWTAFAPTDAAFAKLGLNASNIASEFSPAELADLLLYHVLAGNYSTAQLKGMLGNVIMANGQQAGLKYFDGDIYVNDDSKVIQENIIADNGTIHVVDTVILPPWPRE